jgi:uncharacterized membrane protein
MHDHHGGAGHPAGGGRLDIHSGHKRAQTFEELTQRNIETIAHLENAALHERTGADRVADAISAFCGSMTFVYVHIVWFAVWVILNTLPASRHYKPFDPFPFQFLTLVVSLEAIFLSTFILISQNRQSRITERRNHLDLQINLLAEQENSKMLSMLSEIHRHLGIRGTDPEVAALQVSTEPETLIQQIEEIIERGDEEEERQEREQQAHPASNDLERRADRPV